MSSMDREERGSPVSTSPANRIQRPSPRGAKRVQARSFARAAKFVPVPALRQSAWVAVFVFAEERSCSSPLALIRVILRRPSIDDSAAAQREDSPRFTAARSEERRVGKEGRSRWSPYHYNNTPAT